MTSMCLPQKTTRKFWQKPMNSTWMEHFEPHHACSIRCLLSMHSSMDSCSPWPTVSYLVKAGKCTMNASPCSSWPARIEVSMFFQGRLPLTLNLACYKQLSCSSQQQRSRAASTIIRSPSGGRYRNWGCRQRIGMIPPSRPLSPRW